MTKKKKVKTLEEIIKDRNQLIEYLEAQVKIEDPNKRPKKNNVSILEERALQGWQKLQI